MDSLIFWLAVTVIIALLCFVWIRSVFIDWGFISNDALFLSIMLSFLILMGTFTMHEITKTKIKEVLQKSLRPAFYKLPTMKGNWTWRLGVLVITLLSVLTAYKYVLLADFIKAFAVVAIYSLSIYIISVLTEVLSYTTKPPSVGRS